MRHPQEIDGNDVSRSESYAGLVLMLASFLVSVNVCSAIASLAGTAGRLPPPPAWLPKAIAVVLVAFTVVRNLPGGEFLGPPG